MKRISLLSILVILITSIPAEVLLNEPYILLRHRLRWSPHKQGLVSGDMYYNPSALGYGSDGVVDEEIRYSPYAFNYNSNGLVDNDLEYSPYAFGYNSSGLVDRNLLYSPYAFNYNRDGFTRKGSSRFYGRSGRNLQINIIYRDDPMHGSSPNNRRTESFAEYAKRVTAEKVAARKAVVEKQNIRREEIKKLKANDPSQAISQFLESNNIRFRTNRYLKIDKKIVSVDFVIEDANIIIKFWNEKEISDLHKDDDKKRRYERYFEFWKEYCLNTLGNSRKVYHIISSDKEEILRLLTPCDNDNEKMYALVQDESLTSLNR